MDMVKTVESVRAQGLRDWIVQRVSAVIVAAFTIGLIGWLICHPDLSFAEWHNLFAQTWMKVATIMAIGAILAHAWIGIWTIFTDYVKCNILRGGLNVVVFLSLIACFVWGVMILWGV